MSLLQTIQTMNSGSVALQSMVDQMPQEHKELAVNISLSYEVVKAAVITTQAVTSIAMAIKSRMGNNG